MEDLIRRSDAIKAVEECLKLLARPRYTVRTAIEAIPSVDVDISEYSDKLWRNAYERGKADRPQGEWVYCEDYVGHDGYKCSKCGFFIPWCYDVYADSNFIRHYHTCPHCDSRMKGADDE